MNRRPPDVQGPCGQAWALPQVETKPDHQACLAHWLLHEPGAHPFWEWWYVAVIHLRDLPGVPPAHKKYPEAGFEFFIASINPEECNEPDPESRDGYPFLQPIDVTEQFHGVSDRDAVRIAQAGVNAMVAGRISPDQDFRPMWHDLIWNTVEHFRSGAHVEN